MNTITKACAKIGRYINNICGLDTPRSQEIAAMIDSMPHTNALVYKVDPWNVHEHKNELHISKNCTIYHIVHGQLCFREREIYSEKRDIIFYYPVQFGSVSDAERWIKEGTIKELEHEVKQADCFVFTRECFEVMK